MSKPIRTSHPNPLRWHFPLRRPHTGIPIGNGIQGLLIWGEEKLFVTIARAGFWDHRGGQHFKEGTTFPALKRALKINDDNALSDLFPNTYERDRIPRQYGGGRLELTFENGLRPIDATLDFADGSVKIQIGRHHDDSEMRSIIVRQCANLELSWLELDASLEATTQVQLIPAFDLVKERSMEALGLERPTVWAPTADDAGGFTQKLPLDDSLSIAWFRKGSRIRLFTHLGSATEDHITSGARDVDVAREHENLRCFWTQYWMRTARVFLPEPKLQQMYDYALYRQAGLIRQGAPAATLQGPWMEDTTIPPWSNDYHFNINVQLIYGAALPTGQANHMEPLWKMIHSWLPVLRKRGEEFYKVEGAMLLPHAVDDRCQPIGSFWSGTIDQGCIAWIGQLMYQYYRYTRDKTFLKEIAFPVLNGAFLGYFSMLESSTDSLGHKSYSLPVSVSPEFGGSDRRECWGRDASFQLAAIHSTIELLKESALELKQPFDPRWDEVSSHLPAYSLVDAPSGSYGWIGGPAKRIALWQGKDLTESHRHHSHLAAIYPFCTINPFANEHQKIVARTINRWNTIGAGNWTGWSLPWASILCSRVGLPDAARTWLNLLGESFTNEGYATLHNANSSGVFAWDDGSLAWPDHKKGNDFQYWEIAQMDAAMGTLTAVIEMIVSHRGGKITLTDRLPTGWRDLQFSQIHVEGGFVIDGQFQNGILEQLTVCSRLGGELVLAHRLGDKWSIDGAEKTGDVLRMHCRKDQQLTLRRISV